MQARVAGAVGGEAREPRRPRGLAAALRRGRRAPGERGQQPPRRQPRGAAPAAPLPAEAKVALYEN